MRMSAEIQALYKKNDVSMLASFTTFLTLPIMFAMWQAVQRIEILYQTNMFKGIKEDISLTPIYLQQYIRKQYEVRLTIIAREVYAVRIDTKNKIDWRLDYQNHRYTLIICPEDIIKKCNQMMDDLNLIFGAFDFIVTPEDKWVFLEVNPNGQWLWLEQSLNLDISKKILDNLIK